MVITLLLGSPVEKVAEWVDEYDISFPVLSDTMGVGMRWEEDQARPSQTLIAPGGEIIIRDGHITPDDIEAVLP